MSPSGKEGESSSWEFPRQASSGESTVMQYQKKLFLILVTPSLTLHPVAVCSAPQVDTEAVLIDFVKKRQRASRDLVDAKARWR
jgi:hypothetical protein